MSIIKFEEYSKYFFLALFILLIYLSFLVVKPFISAILGSILLAYIFYPIYKIVNSKLKRKNLSAILVTLLIILLVTIPIIFAVNKIARESYTSYVAVKQKLTTGNLFGVECNGKDNFLCRMADSIKGVTGDPSVKNYLDETLKKIALFVTQTTSNLLFSIPNIILNLFIMFFMMFYLFRDGEQVVKIVKRKIPIKREYENKIFKRFNDMMHAVVYGNVITALIQGVVGAIGFMIFGIPSALFWGVLMAFFALVPYIGTAIIWIPAVIYLLGSGYFGGDPIIFWKGIGLLIYSVIVISSIDNIIKPKIIGTRANVHPLVVLFGVVGGAALFGFIGIIIGPIILTMLITLFEIYEKEE